MSEDGSLAGDGKGSRINAGEIHISELLREQLSPKVLSEPHKRMLIEAGLMETPERAQIRAEALVQYDRIKLLIGEVRRERDAREFLARDLSIDAIRCEYGEVVACLVEKVAREMFATAESVAKQMMETIERRKTIPATADKEEIIGLIQEEFGELLGDLRAAMSYNYDLLQQPPEAVYDGP